MKASATDKVERCYGNFSFRIHRECAREKVGIGEFSGPRNDFTVDFAHSSSNSS
jgi:hypothetical protein